MASSTPKVVTCDGGADKKAALLRGQFSGWPIWRILRARESG